mmetsp:Transcript_6086/g.17422  ORF Transcript_6086/g.17422 Transcript_6086/m.17422 type:complete len:861 (+) Transcript_6086:1179-3761(+)
MCSILSVIVLMNAWFAPDSASQFGDTINTVLDPPLDGLDKTDICVILCYTASELLRVVACRALDPPHQGKGADHDTHGQQHAQQRHEAQAVLSAADGVGEHQYGGDHVVQAPQDGDQQRADDHGACEHLNETNSDGDGVDEEREAVDPEVPECAVANLGPALGCGLKRDVGAAARGGERPPHGLGVCPPEQLVGQSRKPQCRQVLGALEVIDDGAVGGDVDGGSQGHPEVDLHREHAHPDGDDGYRHEDGGGEGIDDIRPHTGAVQPAAQPIQAAAKQGAVLAVQDDLEVPLGPAGALLEAVAHAVRRLPNRQVLVQVPAVPPVALHLHAQREVLRQRPSGGPPRLLVRIGPHQEIGAGAADEAQRVVPRLHVPPEVEVGVVEDVVGPRQVGVVLRSEHHTHVVTRVEHGRGLQEEVRLCHLVGIEHGNKLIARDEAAGRVYLSQDIVHVATLAVHFTLLAVPPGDVDDVIGEGVHPVALEGVLAVVAEVNGALAPLRKLSLQQRHHRQLQDLQGLLVARHQRPDVVLHHGLDGLPRQRLAGGHVRVHRVEQVIQPVHQRGGAADDLHHQDHNAVPLVLGSQVESLGSTDVDVENECRNEEGHEQPAENVGPGLADIGALKHQLRLCPCHRHRRGLGLNVIRLRKSGCGRLAGFLLPLHAVSRVSGVPPAARRHWRSVAALQVLCGVLPGWHRRRRRGHARGHGGQLPPVRSTWQHARDCCVQVHRGQHNRIPIPARTALAALVVSCRWGIWVEVLIPLAGSQRHLLPDAGLCHGGAVVLIAPLAAPRGAVRGSLLRVCLVWVVLMLLVRQFLVVPVVHQPRALLILSAEACVTTILLRSGTGKLVALSVRVVLIIGTLV